MSQLAARFEKHFRGDARVAGHVELPIDRFSVSVLFGPSGSGKTTILRCLAGLETPEEGTIRFGAETWFDAQGHVNLRPQRRGVGYLFQQYALFPHLTVWQNITFGIPKGSRNASDGVAELVHRFELTGLEQRLPRQLSGGQQQRVALARTLACRPRLLLLDEPLSSLDQSLREAVRSQLRGWLSAYRVPTIVVTHDRIDAMALGDRVIVLSGGQVLQHGSMQQVFSSPLDQTVARIVGVETIVEGRILERHGELVCLGIDGVQLWATGPQELTGRAIACIRGEDVVFGRDPDVASSVRNRLPGRITALSVEAPLVRVAIDCGFPLTALITKPACDELGLRVNDRGFAFIKATSIHVMPR